MVEPGFVSKVIGTYYHQRLGVDKKERRIGMDIYATASQRGSLGALWEMIRIEHIFLFFVFFGHININLDLLLFGFLRRQAFQMLDAARHSSCGSSFRRLQLSMLLMVLMRIETPESLLLWRIQMLVLLDSAMMVLSGSSSVSSECR